jgi:putative nucleotidyltransferase with HDIG domain
MTAGRTPPRLVARTLAATLATVIFILAGVFLVITLDVRDRVRASVVDRLETGQQMLSTLEQRRIADLQSQAAALAESPTIKAALDIYHAEQRADTAHRRDLLATVQHGVEELGSRIRPDVLAVVDANGAVVGITGRHAQEWPAQRPTPGSVVTGRGAAFRVGSAPLQVGGAVIGTLYLAIALDEGYAEQLAAVSGARTAILSREGLVATTLPQDAAGQFTHDVADRLGAAGTLKLAGQQYAVRRLFRENDAAVYTLDSIDAAAAPVVSAALRAVAFVGVAALLLAGIASMWLSRSVARPIDMHSRSLAGMTASRNYDRPVPLTGSSREVDALTATFNTVMASLAAAQADTRNAYVGAIRALALALDARDPYTAGHSERVSAISVAMGQKLGLPEADVDVLRLGALLHDIGKIGVPDEVLRKPGALTAEEFDLIKRHPGMGARILRSVPFLAPHLPIVELHHERPDGKGYPHGLRAEEIPVLARIVHVADAFDAITSARAYRPACSTSEGLAELWRWAGVQFDVEALGALAAIVPTLRFEDARIDTTAAKAARRSALVVMARP